MTGESTLRIVIVDDIPESRDNLERLLLFEPDFQVVGKAARGEEAIDLVLRLAPHVVLLDQTLPDLDGIEVASAITARAPGIGVILLGVEQDPEILRRAMLAGAREYLSKPFSYDDLIEAVRRVGRVANPQSMTPAPATVFAAPLAPVHEPGTRREGKVVVVLGSKGGVGRTFIATNLAICLQRALQREVVLVDADLMRGDVAVLLNLPVHRSWTDLARLAGPLDGELIYEFVTRHVSQVGVVLAPAQLEDAERIGAERVQEVLTELRRRADFVIVDTRGGYDDVTLACADVASTLIWILTLEMTAIKETKRFLELVERLGFQQKRIMFVLNQQRSGSGLTVEEVEASLRLSIPIRISSDPQAVIASINEGTPLAWQHRQHRITAELMQLAELLANESREAVLHAGVRKRRLPFLSVSHRWTNGRR
jgi:pilus assembly protein CpaE